MLESAACGVRKRNVEVWSRGMYGGGGESSYWWSKMNAQSVPRVSFNVHVDRPSTARPATLRFFARRCRPLGGHESISGFSVRRAK